MKQYWNFRDYETLLLSLAQCIKSRLARESCALDSGLLQQTNSCPNPVVYTRMGTSSRSV